ncbi:MAG: S41 family peptidase [Cellvibrio sp.]|uniref:S41 family peptidase n=1 Tax=Cellvibrio sp. TaxID=1965322 RepID=UPI002724BF79|nr:S41 family peptidase [Cellvibrio sp.]
MSLTKKWSWAIIGLLAGLLALAVFWYIYFASAQQRATRHLDFVHNAISEMHPAILEPDATEFLKWHKKGYQKARELLSQVRTEADEAAVLRFYMAGYQDSHLNGNLDKRPFSKLDARKDLWTGWLLKATNTGYEVTYRKEGDAYPPKHAKLISCDGQAIDELLQKHYAPYFDIRWQILGARDTAAKALTQDRSFTGVLNRPELTNCDFLVNNASKTYRLVWTPISKDESTAIAIKSDHQYRLPSASELAPGKLWIRASDFGLYTPEAAQHQKALLERLESIKDKEWVILDTRGNRGGNSLHGFQILSRLLDDDNKEYLNIKHEQKSPNANPQFRASWSLYWYWSHQLEKIKNTQGENSEQGKNISQLLTKLKTVLENSETHFYQVEPQSENTSQPKDAKPWQSNIKLVLITDKVCVSACLDLVDMVKLIPNTLHLGEPTDADTVYTEIARMQSQYLKETFNFMVPVKKWNKRLREDNQPYIPDVAYEGDMNDDAALQQWVLAQAEQHFSQR